ncbi:MAG: acetyl/propionyl/methylcrotonyl-CoA carboxylase subunit alpha [Alphaproteobacteria bacterium]
MPKSSKTPPPAPGVRPIGRLLVANRGEIARRVFRTCREMGIGTVAVFSDPDREAPFVREADVAVRLGGASPADSYLRGDAIVEAARCTGADAIHPGYGFLSEDAGFARLCEEAGLVFVGPPADAIAAMGSKLEAKRRAKEAGVPLLETIAVAGTTPEERARAAREAGFPLLVKASAGGGGRGMRIVRDPADLEREIEAAGREAKGAFGDGTLFLEPYLEGARHVEIQVFGDRHGEVVHLFERECSIQRRHQKVVEETPSVAVDDALREKMGAAAVSLARAIGYVGAGTVEFLLAADGRFAFLEVNTRLQVEHPVTECVTGLDLVRLQIEVAEGRPLPESARSPRRDGHAIEVRLCAEDPEQGFLPTTGTLRRFRFPTGPGLRIDGGVEDGSVVGVDYDPMLAKLIAHGPDRVTAARRLAAAVDAMQVHGLRTNRELLSGILRHPEFLAGRTDTHFLERHEPASIVAGLRASRAGGPLDADAANALAATLAAQAARREAAPTLRSLPSGWRNVPSALQEASWEARLGGGAVRRVDVGYRFGRDRLDVRVDGETVSGVRLGACTPTEVELEIDGVLRRHAVHLHGASAWVDGPAGSNELFELDRFPSHAPAVAAGSLLAPMPGKIVRVNVKPGDEVSDGDELLVLEAMKMEHRVLAPRSGPVAEVRVAAGDTVEAGVVLVVIATRDGEGR